MFWLVRTMILSMWHRIRTWFWRSNVVLHSGALEIPYYYDGKRYVVYVPYQRAKIAKMKGATVQLNFENSSKLLTQQPGVPYLIAPRHLNARSATVTVKDKQISIGADQVIDIC